MLRLGHVIALCALALLTLGVVMVNSASMGVKIVTPGQPAPAVITPESIMFSRSTVYMALALGAMGVAATLPVRRLAGALEAKVAGASNGSVSRWGGLMPIGIAAIAMVALCAMVYLPIVGREINGSHRWVGIPGTGKGTEGLTMQPSELAKWGMVILLAWYATSRAAVMHRFWTGLIPALVVVLTTVIAHHPHPVDTLFASIWRYQTRWLPLVAPVASVQNSPLPPYNWLG